TREPALLPALNSDGVPVLIPYYQIINQSGVDLQLITGQWLWKFEGIYRTGQGSSFFASTAGVEYSFVSLFGTKADLGVLIEGLYDDRGAAATTPFENDIMAGVRLAVNDASSTEALFGVIQDLDMDSRFFFVEASRRITDHLKATVEVRVQDLSMNDRFRALRDDDFALLNLEYFF
ncbi:MAG: hypothetical protein V3T30_07600, partial [Thermodesulfobacteriota bacterium]